MLTTSKRVIICYKAVEHHRLNPETELPRNELGYLLSESLAEDIKRFPEVSHTVDVMDTMFPEVKNYIKFHLKDKLDNNYHCDINSLVSKKKRS